MRKLRYAVLAVLMVLGLAVFAAACGGDDDSDTSGGTPAGAVTQQVERDRVQPGLLARLAPVEAGPGAQRSLEGVRQ